MPKTNLTPQARRELILAAASRESPTQLSKQYGVSRSRVYALLEEAKVDVEEKLADAQEELEFRRRMAEKYSDDSQNMS